jgi:hypothetical protein
MCRKRFEILDVSAQSVFIRPPICHNPRRIRGLICGLDSMAKLNARFVETAKPGKYGDASTKGLQLVVAPTGARKWVLRFMSQGKAREMGLGAFPEVGLADARDKALAARKLVKDGVDPIADRQRDQGLPTFGELADEVVAEQSRGFRNDKHKAHWAMTLTVYAAPLRPKPVDKVETADVLAVLKPIWLEKPETASRVRGPYRARPERRQGQGISHGRKSRNVARPPGEPTPEAIQAVARASCGATLCRRSRLRRQAPRAGGNCGPGARIRTSDSRAVGRGAKCPMGRDRPRRQGLDDPARTDEGGARAPRSTERPGPLDPRSAVGCKVFGVHFPRPASEPSAFGHGNGDGPAPHGRGRRRDGPRFPLVLPRLGG